MASILFDMGMERRELKDRLKDFDNLEKNLYPEIKNIVEDLGCDCAVSLVRNDSARCYNSFRVGAQKNNRVVALVEVKFASATPTGDYKVTRISPDGKTVIEHEMCGRPDLMGIIESMLVRSLKGESEAKAVAEDADADGNVADAKECKAALDKYIVGSDKLKGYGLETVLTEDASIGAEMPFARVELGIRADKDADPYFKAGDLLEYYTFDFANGMCHITFHLRGEDWDEMLSDHPSVTSMIEDLVPDMMDELENHDFVNRPGDEN